MPGLSDRCQDYLIDAMPGLSVDVTCLGVANHLDGSVKNVDCIFIQGARWRHEV